MRHWILLVSILFAGCQAMDVARCDQGDIACVQEAIDPADMKAAILYAGPCYRFAYELCHKMYDCDHPRPPHCVEAMVDTICLTPFDADEMNDCAYLMTYAECDILSTPSDSVCYSSWN